MDDLSNFIEELSMDTRTFGTALRDSRNTPRSEIMAAEGPTVEGLNGTKNLDACSEKLKPVLAIGDSQSSPLPKLYDSVNLGNSARDKGKFCHRRVSAVRDFPPLCGPNAPRPTHEQSIRSKAGSVDGVGKIEAIKTSGGTSTENTSKKPVFWQVKSKAVAKRSRTKREIIGGPSMKKIEESENQPSNPSMKKIKKDENRPSNSRATIAPRDFGGDARKQVTETLRSFRSICKKILQDEAKSENQTRRIDLLATKIIKDNKMQLNLGKQFLGEVEGVDVGDEFHYRVELAIVGVHRLYQAGIDSMMHNGTYIAVSVVDAGVYAGDKHYGDILVYSGQGGNFANTGTKNKQPEDQKLEKGNLALKNSISMGTPVRVIRGFKETNSSGRLVTMYVYYGLYTVDRYWQERGPHGKMVFMFELRRIPGQPMVRRK